MALTAASLDSSSISTLFSGMSSSGSSGSGSNNTILSDYYSISNGSYYKMMKAYYSKVDTSGSNSVTGEDDKDSNKALNQIQTDAKELNASANALLAKGSGSVFNKKTTTGEDGTSTTGYDTDAIYKAVSNYIDDYNSMITTGAKSSTTGVLTSVSSMTRATASNSALLGKLGITISSDNKLSIDEAIFKKADMTVAKSLFNSTGSYGYQIASNASMANYYAASESSTTNGYTSAGKYTLSNVNNSFSSYV